MSASEKLTQLNISLPPFPAPVGAYHPLIQHNSIAYLSGQLSKSPEGDLLTGYVGGDVSLEEAKKGAFYCALNALAVLDDAVGIDQIKQILRVVGFVRSAPGFTDQAQVINGASEFLGEVLESRGIHARSAVGVAELPLGAAVELELTVALIER